MVGATLLALGSSAGAGAGQTPEADVVAVVDSFHAALAAGDSTRALSYLAEDVAILEGGGVEDRADYRSGHLGADMRAAQAVERERGEMRVHVVGNVAWAYSTSSRQGRIGDREIDSRGAELVVLARDQGRWMIKAIHWSSRQRR